ncbi:MAG: hypothetical protein HY900_33625 [Deltaproteobacteria bacterium]|nr:hypothetical protein [Deltaproteobacteria bacterium]
MKHFLSILVLPDNIPITALFLAAIFFLWIAFRRAFRNDELTRSGQRGRILEEMED